MEPHANQRGVFQAGGEAGMCLVWQLWVGWAQCLRENERRT